MIKRILLAEDDLAWQQFFLRFFEPFGWECEVVSDWSGLYSVLSSHGKSYFDAIILDLGLGVDALLGIDELEELCKSFEIPIIVTTASPLAGAKFAKRCLLLSQVRQFINKSKVFERLGDIIISLEIEIDPELVRLAKLHNSLRYLKGTQKLEESERTKRVFVVHGQDTLARNGTFEFLRSIGLQPLEWGHAIELTKDPTPYIKRVLETAMDNCGAVLVVLSPDETVNLRKGLRKPNTKAEDIKRGGQARPNVFLELGMAFATNPGKVVVVELGINKIPSDIDGLHRVHLNNSPESRNELAQRLIACGCDVNLRGADWVKAGNLSTTPE